MNIVLRSAIRAAYYPSLAFNRTMCAVGIWQHWNWIDEYVALGAMPKRRHLIQLKELGVGGVVNTCDEFAGDAEALATCGMVQLHLPTWDFQPPSEDDILRGVAFIDAQRAAGRKTYLHCKAGRGRSATLALCYLIADRGIKADEAFRILASARPHVDRRIVRREVVRQFERRQLASQT